MISVHSPRYQRFLARLRAAREAVGMTQRQVARRLRKPQSFVSKSESGKCRVDLFEAADFARLYRKPLEFFVGG